MNDKWATRFELVRGFGWMAIGGIFFFATLFTPSGYEHWPLIFGFLFLMPASIYIYIVTVWHWKARYRGNHSDLWAL
jgi:hypothetical protein